MPQPFVTIDAFTHEAFRGNPAAVCVLAAPRDDAWMAAVAREMNLSETAFLQRRPDGDWGLRWFTPTTEVPLCGHATLAAAHALWEDGVVPAAAPLRFHTLSGVLAAAREDDWIRLDFPASTVAPRAPWPALAAALGTTPVALAANPQFTVAELDSAARVRGLRPDIGALAALPLGTYGVIVTAASDDPAYACVSRFFGPQAGVPEDPVTGAAHCVLGPYWGARHGRDDLTAYQASARGGVVRVRLRGDRVDLLGRAVTVLRGTILH